MELHLHQGEQPEPSLREKERGGGATRKGGKNLKPDDGRAKKRGKRMTRRHPKQRRDGDI